MDTDTVFEFATDDMLTHNTASTCDSWRILLVEGDEDIAAIVADHFVQNGAHVLQIDNTDEALNRVLNEPWDLMVLDLALPGMNGIELTIELKRRVPALPIIMIAARCSEAERVQGLDAGADDYMIKPFSMLELGARARAVLRRSHAVRVPQESRILQVGDIILDVDRHCGFVNGKRIELTAREFRLLTMFVKHPGRVFNRAELLADVWDLSYEGYRHTVNTHINRLRAKLEPDPSQPVYIRTVRGVGYKLDA